MCQNERSTAKARDNAGENKSQTSVNIAIVETTNISICSRNFLIPCSSLSLIYTAGFYFLSIFCHRIWKIVLCLNPAPSRTWNTRRHQVNYATWQHALECEWFVWHLKLLYILSQVWWFIHVSVSAYGACSTYIHSVWHSFFWLLDLSVVETSVLVILPRFGETPSKPHALS